MYWLQHLNPTKHMTLYGCLLLIIAWFIMAIIITQEAMNI